VVEKYNLKSGYLEESKISHIEENKGVESVLRKSEKILEVSGKVNEKSG
jgi:hypothetical protein